MLEISNLVVSAYGPFLTCNDISMCVRQGEIVGVIGPNSTGEGSIVRAVAGFVEDAATRQHSFSGAVDRRRPAASADSERFVAGA